MIMYINIRLITEEYLVGIYIYEKNRRETEKKRNIKQTSDKRTVFHSSRLVRPGTRPQDWRGAPFQCALGLGRETGVAWW